MEPFRPVENATMTAETQAILKAALALPEAERILLADILLDAISPDAEACSEEEFAAELDRRAAECEKDPSLAVPLWEAIGED